MCPNQKSELIPTGHTDVATKQSVPTPLYVTQQDLKVVLRFKTQAEADQAFRMLSALAAAHADHTRQLEELSNARLLSYSPSSDL